MKSSFFTIIVLALSSTPLLLVAQKIVLHNDNGVTLSYSYSFDNNYLCKSNYYDSYRIDVILENNSGKKITTRELSINHINYYKTGKIGDICTSSPGIKFVFETLETGKRISKYYNLLVTKGYPVPRPDYNFSVEFKDVTDNKWTEWKINECYNQLQYRYKQFIDVMPYGNLYKFDVEFKNGYSENIFFDLSLLNENGTYIIGQHFGIRSGNGFTQRFGIGSDENIKLQVSKFCFGTDNSKTAKCDAERNKVSTPPPIIYKPVTSNPYKPGIPNNSNGFSSTTSNGTTAANATNATPTKQLSPEDWKRVQQYELAILQQKQFHDQQMKLQQQNQEQQLQNLQVQQQIQQQEQQRVAYLNQYNEAKAQKIISQIQNTPVKKFEAGKLEIKDVKQKNASGISNTPDIEIEFPEFLGKEIRDAAFIDSLSHGSFEKYLQQKTKRPLGKDNAPHKAFVTARFTITEKGKIEDISIETSNDKFITPVTNAILLSQEKWKSATKGVVPFKQKLSFTVKFE
jgi:hypothetical protein